MTKTHTTSLSFKHCFRRKDWIHNRKNAGLSTGKKAMNELLCDKCKKRSLCMGLKNGNSNTARTASLYS